MKKLITISLWAFIQVVIYAQGTIKGTLLDAETNEGLISANVMLKETATITGTITDFDGKFTLSNIPEGAQTLVISYLGYETTEQTVTVVSGETVDLGNLMIKASSVGLKEVQVVASIAIDRKTPIAVSSISAETIENKLGNQEFPEILRATPSVYVTKSGGGWGDSRINIRGFDQRNIAVMINGIPINDMENGAVYWSNWSGLSEVTRTMQVQRGLGASRLAISSIGGTINIITKTTDQKAGGSFSVAYGNDNYLRASLTLSTGKIKGDWAFTFSGAYTRGDGYVDATQFQGGSYFASISKGFGDKHQLVLTAIGALQRHGQRSFAESLMTYDSTYSLRYNSDWGYRDGKTYNIRENFYHKPQVSLNHYWSINDKLTLSSSAYVSFGRGGGTGDRGSIGGKATWGYRDNDGQIRVDDIINWNKGTNNIDGFPSTGKYSDPTYGIVAGEKDGLIRRASYNSHDWYGLLSNLTANLSKQFMVSGGIDIRYYRGQHYRQIDDLMGANYWLDPRDVNAQNDVVDLDGDGSIGSKETGALKKEGDKIHYHNDGIVSWQGVFAQAEYTSDFGLSAFLSGAFSNSGYQRIDYFQYSGDDQKTPMYNFLGYTVKAGANYNLNKNHNVFFNTGYFSRAATFDVVFPSFNNDANPNAKNEDVFGVEIGYGLRYSKVTANLNLYHTRWMNKSLFKRYQDTQGNDLNANITGLNAIHQGIELDVNTTPVKGLNLRGMVSFGDWKWSNNVDAAIADDDNIVIDTLRIYADGLKVGDSPQTTLGFGAVYTFAFGLSFDADYWHCWDLYADFDPSRQTNVNQIGVQALKLPSYGLLDLGVSYKIKIKKIGLKVRFNMNNVLDTKYIAEADNNYNANTEYDTLLKTARGFYGFGRTWNVSLKFTF
jgi:outer membrane cobalamin receptor